jgi:chromosome segregation ATPase
MEPTDLTIEILKGIREETHKTNERLDKTNDRLDELRVDLRSGLDDLRTDLVDRIERVERRQTETEMRLASELVAVGGAVREVRDLLREDRALRDRVDDHERRLTAVERRTG